MRGRESLRGLLSPGLVGASGLAVLAVAFSLSLSPQTVEPPSVGQPWVSFGDADRLPFITEQASVRAEVVARDLASGDVNEDGVLDFVVGYEDSQGGMVGLYQGNKTFLFPGKRNLSASGPPLTPVAALSVPEGAALVEMGDFDADGHLDVATTAWGSETVYLLMGQGDGTFEGPESFAVPGRVTSMLATPLRRVDALPALILAVDGSAGPRLVIYESARGARHAQAEVVPLPQSAFAVASGYFDEEPARDLVVAAGREVLLFSGESLSEGASAAYSMPARVMSVAVGDFLDDPSYFPEVAVLTADGELSFLERRDGAWRSSETRLSVLDPVETTDGDSSLRSLEAFSLIGSRVSSLFGDDVVVIDRPRRRIRVIHDVETNSNVDMRHVGSLALSNEPVAVLPMRLSPDALDDLVILSADEPVPRVAKTLPVRTFVVNSSGDEDDYALEDGVCAAGAIDTFTGQSVPSELCTLRAAISQANASAGSDAIQFEVSRIDIDAPLPAVQEALLIDASTVALGPCPETNCLTLLGKSAVRGLNIHGVLETQVLVGGSGNIIEGNRFEAGPSGRAILIENGSLNWIGGTIRDAGNHIAGGHVGVEIRGPPSRQNRILGNTFGASADEGPNAGTTLAATLVRTSHNSVGGAEAGAGNIITGSDVGVWIDGADANAILGNTIGVDTPGTRAPNIDGVRIGPGASHNALGGSGSRAGNVISGNELGVRVVGSLLDDEGSGTTGNTIESNVIGVDAEGTRGVGNLLGGIVIEDGASENTIGGGEPGQGNRIFGNGGPGVSLAGAQANQVLGNMIQRNEQAGVFITGGAQANQIGDGSKGGSNEIAHNQRDGVMISSSPGNTVRANAIWSNGGFGINAEGVEIESVADVVAVPSAPVLTRQTGELPGSATVEGQVSGGAGATLILDFFATEECDASGFGEGQLYLGSIQGRVSEAGTSMPFSAQLPLPAIIANITATATDIRGGTSTFSNCLRVVTAQPSSADTPPVLTSKAALSVNRAAETDSKSTCVAPVDLILTNKAISDTKVFEACETIQAGPDFEVLETGDVTLRAGNSVVLDDIAVRTGASFAVVIDPNVMGDPAPVITDFDPKSAKQGTLVTITGTNLVTEASIPTITLNQQGGGTIDAPISSFDPNVLEIVIPTGSMTGPITVNVGPQSDTTSLDLVIEPSSDFILTAVPSSLNLIRGQSATYKVTLESTNDFAQLADLSVSGLPSGVIASFKPQKVTAGQLSVLTVTAPAGQATGVSNLTVSADAMVDGFGVNSAANVSLDIQPITTSFLGRTVVADTLQTPLQGVTVTLLGKDDTGAITGCAGQTLSDAGGNFAFTGLPVECVGAQLIRYDGTTATAPPGSYAGVDLIYTLVEDTVTTSPVLIHLPRIDNAETVMVIQNHSEDQHFTFQTIPNLSATVYAGTVFTLLDGSQPDPFPLTAIQVPVDRLPDEMPVNNIWVDPFIVAFQPANATASQPVAVSFPNLLNMPPGTFQPLVTLDPTLGRMVTYGTGHVSADGRQVIPDFDPAHPGKRYGLVHFDWHGSPSDPNNRPPQRNPDDPGPGICPLTEGRGSIDLSSGVNILTDTDIAINGLRGGISIQRVYRTMSAAAGPFGIGTSHNYSYRLDTNSPQGNQLVNLIHPDGNFFPFVQGAGGVLTNSTVPKLLGAEMTVMSNGEVDLRWKDGTVFHFVPATVQLGSVLESIVDRNGNRVTLVRNPASLAQITKVIGPVGRSLDLTYDGANRIASITDPIGRTVTYTYNAQGTLETVTDPLGGVTQYDYDAQNRLSQVTDARGVVIEQNTYDANDRVIEQLQADGGILQFAHQLFNPLVPNSPVQQTTFTDALGNQTIYRFNPEGFLLDVTDALGQSRVFEREPGSNLILSIHGPGNCEVCGASGAIDRNFTYDANGNILTVTNSLSETTTLTYDSDFSHVTSVTDDLGNVTSLGYDITGNLTSITDANSNSTTFTYGANGLLTELGDPLGADTSIMYDSNANPLTVTDALNNATVLTYDLAGRLINFSDSLGRQTLVGYDALNRIISLTDPAGHVTQFAYDKVGNLLSLTDARGNATTFTYDFMNRVEVRTTEEGRSDDRDYDFNGNLTQFVDRRGQTSVFAYDTLDRLVQETYLDSTVERTYDSQGRLREVRDSIGGFFSLAYDRVGQLLNASGPVGAVRYTYDSLGRTESREVIGQSRVDYGYDPVGNLLSASMPGAAVSFTYEPRNLLATQMRSNGVSTAFNYDLLGRVLSVLHANGGGILSSQTYTYDALGQRSSQVTDVAQPLITQPVAATYDNENRLLQWGMTTYTYDENGNRLTESSPIGTTVYSWDSRDRLRSLASPDGTTTSFRYDFGGNMIAKTALGPGTAMSETYILDDLTNIAYQTASDGAHLSVLTGRNIDSHFAYLRPGGQSYFGLIDALNSTVAVTDQGGSVSGQFNYEPYGETTATGGAFPLQYTGRLSVNRNLYYNRARYYDSQTGRFVSEDPIGFAGGDQNLYRYVRNSPVSRVDPIGLQSQSLGLSSSCSEQFVACLRQGAEPRERVFANQRLRLRATGIFLSKGVGKLGLIAAGGSAISISAAAGRLVLGIPGVIGSFALAGGLLVQSIVFQDAVGQLEEALNQETFQVEQCRRNLFNCEGQCLLGVP